MTSIILEEDSLYPVVINVPSRSMPGENHTVEIKSPSGSANCTCKAWAVSKHCWHVTKVLQWLNGEIQCPGVVVP